MDFPVWSKAIHAQGTVKATAGSVNVPVVCAGAAVSRATSSSPTSTAWSSCRARRRARWRRLSQDRIVKEEKSRARLKAGELGLDFYGLRAKLDELGVK